MIRALYSAASGMKAQELNLDNIANNLANANTVGYKSRRAQFQDLMYQSVLQPGTAAGQQTVVSTGPAAGSGHARHFERNRLHPGLLFGDRQPARPGDSGPGLFPGAAAHRRAGVYPRRAVPPGQERQHRDRQRQCPAAADHHSADAQPITIATDGTVSYTLPNQTAAQQAGQIQLANFQNPAGLNSMGNSLYTPTDASGDATVGAPGGPEGMGSLLQGYTEQSNVSIVDEFINMIQTQRGYEANSKVVTAADNMYQQVNN